MMGVLLRGGNLGTHVCTERPCEDIGSIWPSRSQGERLQNKIRPSSTLLCDSQSLKHFCCETTLSGVLLCQPQVTNKGAFPCLQMYDIREIVISHLTE